MPQDRCVSSWWHSATGDPAVATGFRVASAFIIPSREIRPAAAVGTILEVRPTLCWSERDSNSRSPNKAITHPNATIADSPVWLSTKVEPILWPLTASLTHHDEWK